MSNDENRPDLEEEKTPYTPASPTKRALAWMGIVYMVIIVALTTYNLTTGVVLQGIPGLLLAPGCGGLAAVCLLKYRDERRNNHLFLGIVASLACIINLILGIISLITALGG